MNRSSRLLRWASVARSELEKDVTRIVEVYGLDDPPGRAPALTDLLLKVLQDGLFTAIANGMGVAWRRSATTSSRAPLTRRPRSRPRAPSVGNDEEVQQVVVALLRRALSPAEPFASVQVTDLITAGMHLVVGHCDGRASREALGALSGVVVVLDTPVVLLLLGEPRSADDVERVLRKAVECGMDLRDGPSLAKEIRSRLRHLGASLLRERVDDRLILEEVSLVLDLVDGDGVLTSYVRGRCDGRYPTGPSSNGRRPLVGRLHDMGAKHLDFPAGEAADAQDLSGQRTTPRSTDATLKTLIRRVRLRTPD